MPVDTPARPVAAHRPPDAPHFRLRQRHGELAVEGARPGQQALVRSASGQLAERREQMAVAPRCRYQVRRSRWPSPVGRESASQLRQVVGVRARIDGVVVAVDGVVGQDAHIATVRSERDRVVLRDAAAVATPRRGARVSAGSSRDADAPTSRAAPQRWAVADRRSPPRPHTRALDSPSNRNRGRSSSSWWPCVPTRPGDAPTPSPAPCARTARRSQCGRRRGDGDARPAGRRRVIRWARTGAVDAGPVC